MQLFKYICYVQVQHFPFSCHGSAIYCEILLTAYISSGNGPMREYQLNIKIYLGLRNTCIITHKLLPGLKVGLSLKQKKKNRIRKEEKCILFFLTFHRV